MILFFFCFKQKTAYDVRISDWSSDVCSSDLLATNEKIMELFRREASVLRTVRDDAIVGYDGVLRDEEGRVYLVMEFVDGPSLTSFVEDRVLTLEEVRRLRDRLARGLAAAHDKGVIHRDMSPDNVILGHGDLEHAKIGRAHV